MSSWPLGGCDGHRGLTCWDNLRGFLLWTGMAVMAKLSPDLGMATCSGAWFTLPNRSSKSLSLGAKQAQVRAGYSWGWCLALTSSRLPSPQVAASTTAPATGAGASAPMRTSHWPSRCAREQMGTRLQEPSLESPRCPQFGVLLHIREGN